MSQQQNKKPPRPRRDGLLPWELVRDEYNKKSGEHLSRARVLQIAQDAQRKIVMALSQHQS